MRKQLKKKNSSSRTEIQPKVFLTKVLEIPWGRGRLRLRDVRGKMLVFPGFGGP